MKYLLETNNTEAIIMGKQQMSIHNEHLLLYITAGIVSVRPEWYN